MPGQIRLLILKTVPLAVCIAISLAMSTVLVAAAQSVLATTEPTSRPAADLGREYRQRFLKLADEDVAGHFALAEWCQEQKQYQLALRQTDYVLKLDPEHGEAKTLQSLARQTIRELRRQNYLNRKEQHKSDKILPKGEYVTEKDIHKLRFAELRNPSPEEIAQQIKDRRQNRRAQTAEPAEEVKVRFSNNVLNDFMDSMASLPDFNDREDRTRFLRLPRTAQVQLIQFYSGDKFADRIEIMSDPLIFREFRKIMPIVQSGCATINCHGNSEIKSFRMRIGRPGTNDNLYTNYLILDRTSVNHQPLINRNDPSASLLLHYGMPDSYAKHRHPTGIAPVFASGPEDPKYQLVLNWIDMLSIPRRRNGVELAGYLEPPLPGTNIGQGNQNTDDTTNSNAEPGNDNPEQ